MPCRWFHSLTTTLCLALLFLTLAGCGKKVPKAQIEQASAAVEAGLLVWQKGEAPEVLLTRTPAIQFTEDLWQKGNRLASFEVKRTEADRDLTIRCFVVLTLIDLQGKQTQREIAYHVIPGSPIKIASDPFF